MDWLYLVLVAVMLAALLALFIGAWRIYLNGGFNFERRSHKPPGIRRAKGNTSRPKRRRGG